MIELYTGTPGSGKSFHACKRIYYNLRFGHNVIANFPVRLPRKFKKKGYFEYVSNTRLSVPYLLHYHMEMHRKRKEHQTLVVIDEAGNIFNSRDWRDKNRMEWLNFFALHRHFGFDFVLIAQQDIMIDKQIRGLIEIEVRHRNVLSSGMIGWVMLLAGNFLAITTYYGNKYKVSSEFLRYNKKIARIYDSYMIFDGPMKERIKELEDMMEKERKEESALIEEREPA